MAWECENRFYRAKGDWNLGRGILGMPRFLGGLGLGVKTRLGVGGPGE